MSTLPFKSLSTGEDNWLGLVTLFPRRCRLPPQQRNAQINWVHAAAESTGYQLARLI